MEGAGHREKLLIICEISQGTGEERNDADRDQRRFDGKSATHVCAIGGFSVSMANHYRFDWSIHQLADCGLGDVRGNDEANRGVATLISARALLWADRDCERGPACFLALCNAQARP